MGHGKTISEREKQSKIILSQERKNILNKQATIIPKTSREGRIDKSQNQKENNHKEYNRNKQ